MITLKRHIPNFVDIEGPPPVQSFATTKEMLDDEWVKGWTRPWEQSGPERLTFPFYRFSVGRDAAPDLLMAEYDEGRHWWVVGYLKGDPVDLPDWKPIK